MNGFIEQALIFFGSAVVLVPIFRWLGFGSVLGYLIAGIVVGPFVLKLIHDGETVLHFSELGVVFLLFMIGLEIQPRHLWSMRRHLVGLGGMQVLLTSVLLAGVALSFGLSPLVAGVFGFALSLSSTAFAVQTLAERNQLNTEFGRASFAILLAQDLVAIPALAVLPMLGMPAGGEALSATGFGWAILVIVLLVAVSRFLTRPLFRVIATTRSREIFTATTLFLVLGVAALMQKVGLSAALGTFIAGVLLAESEYRHELETNLEPFKSLLMGLFFIAVGINVRLDFLFDRPLTIMALAIGYLSLKGLVIYSVGRWFKMNHINAKLMALNVAQGGEFAFVIFGMIGQLNMTTPDHLALLTVVITMSMALSPVLSFANDFLARRQQRAIEPTYDDIPDEAPEVIIAGFGRFGQVFARILRAQEIPFVAIDHDPNQIELVRRFGNKVYFGDASRQDLLAAAGAAKAKYLILAIDEVEASVATAKLVLEHFPHLKVYARARNRGHVFDLMALGLTRIKRETFDSSVYFTGELLKEMGFKPDLVQTIVEKFKRHDEIMLQEQFKVRSDDKQFVSVSQQGVAQLAQVLREDQLQSHVGPTPAP